MQYQIRSMVQTFRILCPTNSNNSEKGYQQCFQFFLCWKFQWCTPFSFKKTSSKTVEFLQSLNEKLILNAIQSIKCSSAVTSDSFLCKILHLRPLFFPVFSFHYSHQSFQHAHFLLSGKFRILIRCASLESKMILPTIGPKSYQTSRYYLKDCSSTFFMRKSDTI